MRFVHALHLPHRILVHPLRRTTAGVWIAAPPYLALDPEAGADQIGEAVLMALGSSVAPVIHPQDWNAVTKERLAAAGVSSEAKLQSLARLVHVRAEQGRVIVTPTHNGGVKGTARGFSELNSHWVEVACDGRLVGSAVAAAFDRCTR